MEPQSLRVLIAEDESLVAELIDHELRSVGVEVVGRAHDGRQAVDMTCALRPDAVVMDVRMPVMDGIEAAEEIQRLAPTPVVLLTVHTEHKILARAAEAGVGAYLTKPVRGEEMIRAIWIARARAEDMAELRRVNAELHAALAEVGTLSGMLPICSSCKKIRDGRGAWQDVETFVREHTAARFTHGFCPECAAVLYPGATDET
jgi:two-component system, response regulator PdtaR